MHLIYGGPPAALETYAGPFRALGPSTEASSSNLPYLALFDVLGYNETSTVACGKGMYRHLFPAYLKRYNATALRKVHGIFTNTTNKYPDVALTSIFAVEGYATQGLTAVPDENTATPFRDYSILA